MEDKDITC